VLDRLAARFGQPRRRARFNAQVAEVRAPVGADGRLLRLALIWPQTYMNESGRAVSPARGSYRVPLSRLLVIHDEIDLPFGTVRVRRGGGPAGHNGLKSLARELAGSDFWRVRVGVGRPRSTDPEIVAAYVLARFGESREQVQALLEQAEEATLELLGAERANDALAAPRGHTPR
jgi:PTH1 family peptidyl-tRNA hydrolase